MDKLQRILYNRLRKGDPKLRSLFEQFVANMGHNPSEAEQIVESIVNEDDTLLTENMSLADQARYRSLDED